MGKKSLTFFFGWSVFIFQIFATEENIIFRAMLLFGWSVFIFLITKSYKVILYLGVNGYPYSFCYISQASSDKTSEFIFILYTQTSTHIIIYTNNIITKNNAYLKITYTHTHNIKNNARNTNYFSKCFTNCWCGEWLLVNEKMDINGRPK